ncbi:MAG: class I SAM-dependent methyltransferase [Sulfurospirillaceae bacterium]|nr:class I SAM-dependent methyltransferase [Sulfurospirillaceae bacterium]
MKCKICDTQTVPLEDKQLQKIYFLCPCCEYIFLDENYVVSQDRELSQYQNHNNSLENIGYVNMFENFIDFFYSEIENPKKAFDFGSGPKPVLSQLFERKGLTCSIYDKFYACEKTYQNSTYDIITSTEVFEHLGNPLETLRMLKSLLNPQGIIAIMTLFHNNSKEDFLNWWYRRDPTHIGFFTPQTFDVLANICGLEVVKHDNKRVIVLRHR